MKDLMIHGNWKVQETGNYKGGLRDGNWYFMILIGGGVRIHVAEGQYYKGKKVGHWTYYVPDFERIRCDVCASGEYDDDLKVGKWEYQNMQHEYFDRMKIRGYYLKNYPQELEHKPWTKYVERYYPNGNIQEFGYSDYDGHKVGEWLYFYPNGNLKETGKHSSGKKIGTWKSYYENGYPKEIGDYFRYERIGLW